MSWPASWIKHRMLFLWGGLLLLGLLIRLYLSWHGAEFLISNLLPDDAFYYFKIAENIVRGNGSTFDAIHVTNGYHPLWMGICLIVYKVFQTLPRGETLPVQVLLTIASVLDIAIIIPCIYFFKRLQLRPRLQLGIAALYLFNPWVIAHALNGLESALANTLLLATAAVLVQVLTSEQKKRATLIAFSLLAAGTILARIDYALLIAVLGLYLLWKQASSWNVKEYFSVFLPGGIVLVLWGMLSWHVFGALVPQSGFAFSLVNKTLFFYKPRSVPTLFLWCLYQWFQSLKMAAYVSGMSWLSLIILAAFGLKLAWEKKQKQLIPVALQVLALLIVGFIIFTFFQGAVRWSGREWYFSLGPILSLLALSYLFQQTQERFRLLKITLVLVLVVLSIATNELQIDRFSSQGAMYRVAKQLSQSVDTKNVRIGAYNAGIYGYYADATIVNLDGLVNISAYHALRDKRMYRYLQEEKIEYILDYAIATNYRYAPFWGKPNTDFLVPLKTMSEDTSYHGSTLLLMKVTPDGS